MTSANHKRAVKKGISIVQAENDAVDDSDGPFVVIGNPNAVEMKSFQFKVRCKVCGDLIQLCLLWKNLCANLDVHLNGIKHMKVPEDSKIEKLKASGSVVSTSQRGHPSTSGRAVVGNQ